MWRTLRYNGEEVEGLRKFLPILLALLAQDFFHIDLHRVLIGIAMRHGTQAVFRYVLLCSNREEEDEEGVEEGGESFYIIFCFSEKPENFSFLKLFPVGNNYSPFQDST